MSENKTPDKREIFSPEQVKNLDEFQRCGFMHPFTCANRGDGKHFDNGVDKGALIPTTRGWICQCCDYTQDWAHDFMLNGSMVKSSPHAVPSARTESLAARRYERLRILGCAPAYTKHLASGTVLRFQGLDEFVDEDLRLHESRGEAKSSYVNYQSPNEKK